VEKHQRIHGVKSGVFQRQSVELEIAARCCSAGRAMSTVSVWVALLLRRTMKSRPCSRRDSNTDLPAAVSRHGLPVFALVEKQPAFWPRPRSTMKRMPFSAPRSRLAGPLR